jgi:hypothetical protein
VVQADAGPGQLEELVLIPGGQRSQHHPSRALRRTGPSRRGVLAHESRLSRRPPPRAPEPQTARRPRTRARRPPPSKLTRHFHQPVPTCASAALPVVHVSTICAVTHYRGSLLPATAPMACRLTCAVRVIDLARPPRDDLRVPSTELEDTGGGRGVQYGVARERSRAAGGR